MFPRVKKAVEEVVGKVASRRRSFQSLGEGVVPSTSRYVDRGINVEKIEDIEDQSQPKVNPSETVTVEKVHDHQQGKQIGYSTTTNFFAALNFASNGGYGDNIEGSSSAKRGFVQRIDTEGLSQGINASSTTSGPNLDSKAKNKVETEVILLNIPTENVKSTYDVAAGKEIPNPLYKGNQTTSTSSNESNTTKGIPVYLHDEDEFPNKLGI